MKSRKRILFITPTLSSGGAERQMVNLAVRFKHLGTDVEFLVYSNEDFYSHILTENGIKIHWMNLPKHFDRIIKVRRFIRGGGYDAVISFLEVANFLNNVSALGFRRKSWKTITGERSSHEKVFQGKRAKLFCRFMRFSDVIVCNSNNARQMWIKHYPQYANKLSVIYNTVVIPQLTSAYRPKAGNRLNIVIAATLYDIKNPVNVIKALGLMTEAERKKVHIDWYGRVPELHTFDNQVSYKESLHLIEQYKLKGTITILDPTTDIYNKMNEADVVALFSLLEGLPNTIAEGMMIGKPIIMSCVSDYNQFVNDKNGFLCDPADPTSIKDAILKAASLTDIELFEMGKQSKLKAEQLFSEQINDHIWSDLLNL